MKTWFFYFQVTTLYHFAKCYHYETTHSPDTTFFIMKGYHTIHYETAHSPDTTLSTMKGYHIIHN